MNPREMSFEEYNAVVRKFAARKGLIFNRDEKLVHELIEGLLANKKRYGYAGCPCRLNCGDMGYDKDIVCPCVYSGPDIEQYGKCFCGLYVNEEFNAGKIPDANVPERRPPEKMCY